MTDDAELLRRYAEEKSEPAFAEFTRRSIDLVYASALRQTRGNPELAQEVTQTVFTDVARKASALSRHAAIIGWLHTATRFAAAKALRSRHRRWQHERQVQMINEEPVQPRPELAWEHLQPAIDQVLGDLNDRERAAILHRYFEKKTLAEVGAKLALTETAARSCIDRALEKMRLRFKRRGVTSTATALANHPAVAAPVSLAASVTGGAFAGLGASTTGAALGGLLASMTTTKTIVASAAILAVLASSTAFYQSYQARQISANLATANLDREALISQIAASETRATQAEQRAKDAEKDSGELLKALQSYKAQQAAIPPQSSSSVTSANPPALSDQERLSYERTFQIDTAKRRSAQALVRAEIQDEVRPLNATDKFNLLMSYAAKNAAKADFQEGIRFFNQAMAAKPADLPISPEIREMQTTLLAQNQLVSVPVEGDGQTSYIIPGGGVVYRPTKDLMKILPGDYEIIARRTGFQDVLFPLRVRNGESPPTISVACTVAVQE